VHDDLIAVPAPDTVEGFRFAVVLHGAADDGTPLLWAERAEVTVPTRFDRVLRYLADGAAVYQTTDHAPDRFDPTRRFAVPGGYRTDGLWIWPEAVAYYLREHGVPPDPGLSRRIAGCGYRCPPVTAQMVERARAALATRARIIEERVAVHEGAAAVPAHEAPAGGDRFPPDVTDVLLRAGWVPGRDVQAHVVAWLENLLEDHPWVAEERAEALAAGRNILAEFGGLHVPLFGPGAETALLPFDFHPGGDTPDPYAFEHLSERLGSALFPLGTVADGRFDLVVDGVGRVYLTGDVDRYLGATIDEALVRLVRGIAAPPAGRGPG
jgi:hypothetical protein